MSNPRREIETLCERIEQGKRGGETADREKLLAFSDRLGLLREEYGDHRHLKLLRHCTRMAEHPGGLANALTDRDATENIVRWIHSEYDPKNGGSHETNRDYRVALRVFGRRVTDKGVENNPENPPASIAWVSSKTSRNYKPTPDPSEMLEWEDDVKPMLDAARNPRDAALIAVQFDAGLRGTSELYELKLGDVSDGEHGVRLRVDGKTGQRSVDLIPSIPYLNKWLAEHPAGDDSDAYLWSKLTTPGRYSYQRFLKCFKESAERAGITKPVTPTNFRKSNATWLAKQGANAALIEDRQGRTRGSKAVARYVARFGDDAEAQYARLNGKEVETDEPDDLAPLVCPRCDKDTPRDEPKCVWCGQVLDYDAMPEIEAQQRELRDAVLRLGKENPEVLDDVRRTRDLMTVFEDNPDLFEDTQGFIEALSDG